MVDTVKAKYLLGFEPAISLAQGLRDTVEWYKHNQDKTMASVAKP
jgi:nucleoside-diphosphate-sugar epimerase